MINDSSSEEEKDESCKKIEEPSRKTFKPNEKILLSSSDPSETTFANGGLIAPESPVIVSYAKGHLNKMRIPLDRINFSQHYSFKMIK